MQTFYGQRRTYFHNVRFSPEEERILQKRKEKYRYQTVSDFIRDAALDEEIKVVTEVYQERRVTSRRHLNALALTLT